MIVRLLVFLVTLALLPTSLLAGPRALVAAPLVAAPLVAADGFGEPTAIASGETAASAFVVSGTRCKRGAMPASACGADTGLPVAVVSMTAPVVRVGFDDAASPMAGLPPACLVGPPQSC